MCCSSVSTSYCVSHLLSAAQCCRPEAAVDLQYTSDTEYSDDDGSDEEEEDDISVCSGSTISVAGQSCTASDLMGSGFDEAYSDGLHPLHILPTSHHPRNKCNSAVPACVIRHSQLSLPLHSISLVYSASASMFHGQSCIGQNVCWLAEVVQTFCCH